MRTRKGQLVAFLSSLAFLMGFAGMGCRRLNPTDGAERSEITETVRRDVVARGGSSTAVPDNAEIKLSANGRRAVARFWLSVPDSKTGGGPVRVSLVREGAAWHVAATKPGWSSWDHAKRRTCAWLGSRL